MKKLVLIGLSTIILSGCYSKGPVETVVFNNKHWIEINEKDQKPYYRECILNQNKLPGETVFTDGTRVCREISKDTYADIKNKFMDKEISPEALLPGKSLSASEVAEASSK